MKTLPDTLFEKPHLSRFIWETFLRNKKWAVTIILLRCAALSSDIFWPYFNKVATDQLVITQQVHAFDWHALLWCGALGIVSWYIEDFANVASSIISSRRIAAMRAGIRLFLLKDLYQQSQQFFHDRFAGSIGTSLRDASDGVTDIINEIVYQFIPAIVLFFCLGYILFKLYIGYIILLLVWMVWQILLVYFTRKHAQSRSRNYADKRSELFGKLIDSISNYLSVASFTAHAAEHDKIKAAEDIVIDKRVKVIRFTQATNFSSVTVEVAFIFFGFFPMYLYQFQKGDATVGDLMLILLGIYGLMKVVQNISDRMLWLYEQIGICQDAIRKIVVPRQIKDIPGAKDLVVHEAVIEIDQVSFSYFTDKPVLRDVSFLINRGEKIGLVGYSGAGKTTFANLLMRFYEVTKGRILIDGQDIREVTQESLRRAIAMIPQDTSLFHRSLYDNIRIARPEASDDEVMTAARMAGAHDFIMNLQNQYETMVGERGVKLSGGQRQRVAIARAFLKAAPILILDEATSALDSVTEQGIQDALEKVMTGRTTIVIAHRLSTLRRMDRILVFDQGQIVEQGNHDELLTANGHYAKMWAMQAGGFLPEKEQ